jgi:inosose dehydratase
VSIDAHAQRFDFGYEVITWEFGGLDTDAGLSTIAQEGFPWCEALLGDTLGGDFARRFMTLGFAERPQATSDVDMFNRLAAFADVRANYGLKLASLFCDGEWVNPRLWPDELAKAKAVAHFLDSCGAPILVCGGGPPEGRDGRTTADYEMLAGRLQEIGRYTAELGIRTVYHPHLDTFVETRQQLDRLMDVLDVSLVGLCIDPAHLQETLSDPVDIFKTYADAINYVHLKDCTGDQRTLAGYDRYLAFAPLGVGIVDVEGIVGALLDSAYDGIVIVELDYSPDPDAACRQSAAYIRDKLGLQLSVGS